MREGSFDLVFLWESERVLGDRLGDGTGADQTHRHATGNDGTVFDNLDSLEVAAVDTLGNTGSLATVATEIFCFTAFGLFVATAGFEVAVEINKGGALDAFVLFQSAHFGAL